MKIERLDLIAFGPFTGKTLALDGPGLQLVYGPNEAGKSSTLRALLDLLFDFEHATDDNFIHSYQDLRVGALLRNAAGQTFECVRKKGKLNTLLHPETGQPLDETPLREMLPDVGREKFSQQFGIDHPELKRGGAEMVAGGGELGNALFAASSGYTSLSQVQKQLAEEADQLYTPRASVRALNVSLGSYDEKQKTVLALQTPSEEWRQQRDALSQHQQQREKLDQQLAAREAALHRLEREIAALGLMSRRDTLLSRREELSGVPLLSQGFSNKRREADLAHHEAQANARSATAEIKAAQEKLASRQVASVVLTHAAAIETLHETSTIQQRAERDKKRLKLEYAEKLTSIRSLMQQLGLAVQDGQEPDFSACEPLRLTTAQRTRIQNLGQKLTKLQTRVEETTARVQHSTTQVRHHKQRLQNLSPPVETAGLRRVIDRTLRGGDLEQDLENARNDHAKASSRLEAKLSQLPKLAPAGSEPSTATSDAAAALHLPAPPAALIEQRQQAIEEAAAIVDKCQTRVDVEQAELEKIEQDTRKLREQEAVPMEEDLDAARNRRSAGWRLVQGQWLGAHGHQSQAEHEAAIARFVEASPAEDLPAAFEAAMRNADDVADRLRRDAHHVATLKNYAEERSTRLQHLARYQQQLEDAQAAHQEAQQQWVDDWRKAGVMPLSPAAMMDWLRQREVASTLADEVRNHEQTCKLLEGKIQQCQDEITAGLIATRLPAPATSGLSDLLDAAASTAQTLEQAAHDYQDATRQIEQSQQELQEATSRRESAATDLAGCQAQWTAAIQPLGLDAETSPEEANAVINDIQNLFEKIGLAQEHRGRIAGIEEGTTRFAEAAVELAATVAPEWQDASPFEAADAMLQQLKQASHDDTLHREHTDQLHKAQQRLTDAQREMEVAAAHLKSLCKEAGCQTTEELTAVEEKSNERRSVQQQLREIDERMSEYAGGADLETFLAATRQQNLEELETQRPRLKEEIATLKRELQDVDQAIGSTKTELARFDGRADAAEAAEESQFLVSQIRDQVQQYARLKLAAAVLQQAITRYRDRHQSRVLSRASELFKELTCGSFSQLKPVDDDGKLVLTGIRNNKEVRVEGMSDGSCDQLYLALRLASLENYLDDHPPVPFIADDILVSFDDRRAAAALKVLARLAQRTQVIFFTHHQHLHKVAAKHLSGTDYTAVHLESRQAEHANLLF